MIEETQSPNPIMGFISLAMSKTGFTSISLAITAALGIAGYVGHKVDSYFAGIAKYEEGYTSAIKDIEKAQNFLDVETDASLDEFDDLSDKVDEEIGKVKEDFNDDSKNAVTDLKTAIDNHSKAIARLERKERPKTTWGSNPVPDAVRLRFKRRDLERERDSTGSGKPSSTANN